ncbi:MAG: transporter substrate-binding domain-containing protein [Sphingobacteriia bacterium]|nr:transporter substrate-binding domain-containing protein [Sphingobacteriia bacterium]
MFKITPRLAALLMVIAIVMVACKDKEENRYPHNLDFFTEEYKPFNYSEEGQLKGLGPELLSMICDRLAIPFEVQVLPWDEALAEAQDNPEAVLFSTILTPDRKDHFNWAGPYASIDWKFYCASSSNIDIQTLEDARQVEAIGVIPDFSIEEFLVNEGFTNLVDCENSADAFEKLLNGTITLFPSSEIATIAALESINHSIYDVRPLLTLETSLVYFAFNKVIPEAVSRDFQQELDELKLNGSLETLYQRHMQTSGAPDILQFYTEQYPPLTYRNSFGEITGFGTDLVKEIMRRNQRFYDIRLSLWSNGYQLALHNPNFCLFTMDRTEIREELFNWVGPIGTNITYFYVKTGSGITINTVDEARNLNAIGTVSSWFSDQYLRELGFINLVAQEDPAEMVTLLMDGAVQAIVCSNVTIADILHDAGYEYEQITPTVDILSSDYYIAFSKNTDNTILTQWQTTLDDIKADGTYEAVFNKWFPNQK